MRRLEEDRSSMEERLQEALADLRLRDRRSAIGYSIS